MIFDIINRKDIHSIQSIFEDDRWKYRSLNTLVRESGLSTSRCMEVLSKSTKFIKIYSDKRNDLWGLNIVYEIHR